MDRNPSSHTFNGNNYIPDDERISICNDEPKLSDLNCMLQTHPLIMLPHNFASQESVNSFHSLPQSKSNDLEDCPESVLIISVHIRDGQTGLIHVKQQDDPSALARLFCEAHSLPAKVQNALAAQIEASLSLVQKHSDSESNVNQIELTTCLPPSVKTPSKKPNVYERLFSAGRTRNLDSPQLPPKKKISQKAAQRLYYLGLANEERKKKKLQLIQDQLGQQQVKEAVFKPQINKQKAASRYKLLYTPASKEPNQGPSETYTFSPSIDRKSRRLAKGRSEDLYSALYNNAKETQQRVRRRGSELQETHRYKEMCSFNPDLQKTAGVNKSLLSRQKKEEAEEVEQESEVLFKPKIGKPPKRRDFNPSEVGEHLYSLSFRNRDQESAEIVEPTKDDAVFKRLKLKRFQEYFECLNPVNGVISHVEPQNCRLDRQVYEVLSPFLNEIEGPLTFKDFTEIMEMYYKLLDPIERQVLLGTKKKAEVKKETGSHTKRGSVDAGYMYEREKQRKREGRLRAEKAMIQNAAFELKSCTFRPKIRKYKSKNNNLAEFL